ncbi:hypothetical protein TUE45_02798 [Streptomyces reticuli]|nr:hypothetical protein TUE45_02798 [Streptomyces reticuli]
MLKYAAGLDTGAEQRMTSAEWLHCLTGLYSGEECRPLPKGWPTTGKVLSDRLKRLQPTLGARGVLIDWGRTRTARYIEMARPPAAPPHEQEPAF